MAPTRSLVSGAFRRAAGCATKSSLSRRRPGRRSIALLILAPAVALACGSSARPTVTEFDLPDKAGSTHELTVGPDGNVWVTQQTQAMLVRVTPAGKLRFVHLPAGSGPHGVRFDTHDHLWITLQFTDAIAELNLRGQIVHTYPIPHPSWLPKAGAGPHGLTVAGDGSVWWTGKTGGVIGRLDPRTGRTRLFRLPDPDSQPIYVAQGCDGMYFTELNNGRIGRIGTNGKLTEYQTPTADSRPIAVAPHGCRIWFTEERGGRFGVLDPATRKITEYPTRPGQMLAGLAFDKANTLWLAFSKPDAIGRVGPQMQVTEFPLPTKNAVLHRIILGPGGNMWLTELAADKVGYITT